MIKKCTRCKLEKHIEEFTTKTGNVTTKCKKCLRKDQLEWRNKNKEKVNARKKELYQEDLENKRSYARKSAKRFSIESKEKRKIITARYREKNREELNKKSLEYANRRYAEEKKRKFEIRLNWQKDNPKEYSECLLDIEKNVAKSLKNLERSGRKLIQKRFLSKQEKMLKQIGKNIQRKQKQGY